MSQRELHLRQLYEMLARVVGARTDGPPLLRDVGRMAPTCAGVYFFFEAGEVRRNQGLRVVRVGMSSRSLRSRLVGQHLTGNHRDDHRDDEGNLRASVFRKHVGAALIRRDCLACRTWRMPTEPDHDAQRRAESDIEGRVTQALGAMPVVWVVANGPDNRCIEQNAIGLLSNYQRPVVDPPSAAWLGRSCDREEIRKSGLWNVKHVTSGYDPAMLEKLDTVAGG